MYMNLSEAKKKLLPIVVSVAKQSKFTMAHLSTNRTMKIYYSKRIP